MNKQIIDKFLLAMLDTLQTAKDFTLEQAPDIMRQVITWNIGENIFSIVLCVGFFVALGLLVRFVYRTTTEEIQELRSKVGYRGESTGWTDYPERIFPLAMFGGFGFVLALYNLIASMQVLLQLWLAPKIFLIEYFAGLVK